MCIRDSSRSYRPGEREHRDERREERRGGRDREHRRERSRHRERRSRRDRTPEPELDDEPIQYKVYDGRVTGVKDFGAFVTMLGVKGKVDGLVHVSAIADYKVNHPSDLLSRDQPVKVKVMKVDLSKAYDHVDWALLNMIL